MLVKKDSLKFLNNINCCADNGLLPIAVRVSNFGGGVELPSSLVFGELGTCKCKIENGKWKIIFPLCTNISFPTGEGATHVNIFQNYCKITKSKYVAMGGTTRRETIISSPTGEGATHVNIFQNYCKITKNKCVARWGLARKGGALC